MGNEGIMSIVTYLIVVIGSTKYINPWPSCFAISLMAYKSAMYLHENPSFLIDMFLK